jgi:hypothetical protein
MSGEDENHRRRAALAELDDAHARTGLYGASYCIFCGALHGLQRSLHVDDECTRCASPLFPAARQRLDFPGQRMLERMTKRGKVVLYLGWPESRPVHAEMRDLSLNGMRLATDGVVPVDQIVKVDSEICCALARIAHCERVAGSADRWTLGVEFLTLRFRKRSGAFVPARA